MNITVEIKKTFEDAGKLKAIANLVIDEGFVIKNVRLVNGDKGLFVSMPKHKIKEKYVETCHPIKREVREKIEKSVLEAYLSFMGSN